MSNNRRAPLTEQDMPRLALPERLAEPELSAFRAFHARIKEAEARLALANEAWATFAPVLANLYRLGLEDQIDGEGRIHRATLHPENGD